MLTASDSDGRVRFNETARAACALNTTTEGNTSNRSSDSSDANESCDTIADAGTLQVGERNDVDSVWVMVKTDGGRRGCEPVSFESAECLPDRNMVRPTGAALYKAASWYSGAGVMDLGAKRGGFVISAAAERDTHHHAGYLMNFGVTPAPTNAECFARMPSDIVAVFFGFDCTSMAKNGRRQGLAHSSWQDFDAAVAALKEKQVMAFHCENVADLLTADQFKAEREHVLGSFRDAGYVTIQGVADPADFGWPCSRRRCHILGQRCDVAERVGWGKQSVITHPFDTTKKRSPRCVADFMAQPRGETLEDDGCLRSARAARSREALVRGVAS